jgi:hypothetical protein
MKFLHKQLGQQSEIEAPKLLDLVEELEIWHLQNIIRSWSIETSQGNGGGL